MRIVLIENNSFVDSRRNGVYFNLFYLRNGELVNDRLYIYLFTYRSVFPLYIGFHREPKNMGSYIFFLHNIVLSENKILKNNKMTYVNFHPVLFVFIY